MHAVWAQSFVVPVPVAAFPASPSVPCPSFGDLLALLTARELLIRTEYSQIQ